jgi:predicted transcriptional regulator
MGSYKLADTESKFADLVWDNAPINSGELVLLSEKVMKWKKSTTYTILKRLCDKGIFENDNATITVAISRDEYLARQSRRYVEDAFGGSLPKFITSFIGGKRLTDKQADEIQRLIDEYREGNRND